MGIFQWPEKHSKPDGWSFPLPRPGPAKQTFDIIVIVIFNNNIIKETSTWVTLYAKQTFDIIGNMNIVNVITTVKNQLID